MWWLIGIGSWFALSFPLGILIGKAIKLADQKEGIAS